MALTSAIVTFIDEKCLFLQEKKVETSNRIELMKEETKLATEELTKLEARILDKYEVIDFLKTNIGRLNEFRDEVINIMNQLQEEIIGLKNVVKNLKEAIKENERQIELSNAKIEGFQNMHELFAGFKEYEETIITTPLIDISDAAQIKKRGRPKTNDAQIS
jgi:chromosome segregation ATPase